MKLTKLCFLVAVCTSFWHLSPPPVNADDACSVRLKKADSRSADKPSSAIKFRIPGADDDGGSGRQVPSEGENVPPQEPHLPPDESTESPEFFGEPLGATTVFILDYSLSMVIKDSGDFEDEDGNIVTGGSRLDLVKAETIRTLNQLSESDRFDFVILAGCLENPGQVDPPVTNVWQGRLVEASPANVSEAQDFILTTPPRWGTPTDTAVRRACTEYGSEIDTLILLSDGAPTNCDIEDIPHGIPYQSEEAQNAVIANFTSLYAPLKAYGCKLVCIKVGKNAYAGSFMQKVAAANDGMYVQR